MFQSAVILKGVGKINGDGWKDTTKVGEIVFVWNAELSPPYAPGQFPRVGNEVWAASTTQYDFTPATIEEVRAHLGGADGACDFTAPQIEADPILKFFHYGHLPQDLQKVSRPFCELARQMIAVLPRNAERTVSLRKLLEAKDAAVRANVW